MAAPQVIREFVHQWGALRRGTGMKCPSCSTSLQAVKLDPFEAAICDRCEGLWLPGEVVREYVRQRLLEAGRSPLTGLLETPPASTDLPCPICRDSALERIKLRGVEVERCTGCGGLFFEAGELDTIVERVLYSAEQSELLEEKRAEHRRRSPADWREWRAQQRGEMSTKQRIVLSILEVAAGAFG